MKPILMIAALLVAGCATGPTGELSGRHDKNSGEVSVERLGSITTAALPGELRCGSRQVMWCAGGRSEGSCECIYTSVAKDKYLRMAGQIDRTRNRIP